jgi:hypothetical protein
LGGGVEVAAAAAAVLLVVVLLAAGCARVCATWACKSAGAASLAKKRRVDIPPARSPTSRRSGAAVTADPGSVDVKVLLVVLPLVRHAVDARARLQRLMLVTTLA